MAIQIELIIQFAVIGQQLWLRMIFKWASQKIGRIQVIAVTIHRGEKRESRHFSHKVFNWSIKRLKSDTRRKWGSRTHVVVGINNFSATTIIFPHLARSADCLNVSAFKWIPAYDNKWRQTGWFIDKERVMMMCRVIHWLHPQQLLNLKSHRERLN